MYSVAPPRVAAFLQYKEVSPMSSSVANERFLGLLDQLFKQNFASGFFFFVPYEKSILQNIASCDQPDLVLLIVCPAADPT